MSIRALRSAVGFLTLVPVGGAAQAPASRLGRAYFPVVGAAIGLAAGGMYMLAATVLTPLVAAAAAVVTAAVLTGGLHLDGLADSADGLFGGHTPEHRLEIMRDPRIGSFGVTALILVMVADVALLTEMTPLRALTGLVVAGAFSRLAMLGAIAFLPYVRTDGLGVAAGGGHRVRDFAVGVILAALAGLLNPWRSAVAAGCVALTTLVVVILARRRIGGATGDIYGTCAELGQMAALVAFAVH
jgi:adenosylcobinamide-GDP ribazoletransferase